MPSTSESADIPDPSPNENRSPVALNLELREFIPEDAASFRELNAAWIERYFEMEEADRLVLSDPVGQIIQPGGHIYMAYAGGRAVGCCALILVRPNVYEIAKMAVAEEYRGHGVGRQLLAYVIGEARTLGALMLTLVTNDSLANAIHLYESLGFRHLPPEPSPYKRANVFMELSLA